MESQQPGLSMKLAPPTTEAALAAVEAEIGAALPAAVRESWLRHNGSGTLEEFFPGSRVLVSAAGMVQRLRESRAAGWTDENVVCVGPVRAVGWDPLWVPLNDGEGRCAICVDLHPAEAGRHGQIITVAKAGERSVAAPSWPAWLTRFAEELDRGEYVWSEDEGLQQA
jgi:cell wall assembly regulator SMI1